MRNQYHAPAVPMVITSSAISVIRRHFGGAPAAFSTEANVGGTTRGLPGIIVTFSGVASRGAVRTSFALVPSDATRLGEGAGAAAAAVRSRAGVGSRVSGALDAAACKPARSK